MKVNTFLTIISLLLTGLLSYLVYSVVEGQDNDVICGTGSAVCIAFTLLPMIGLRYKSTMIGTNVRVLSVLFFLLFIVSHAIFIHYGICMPYYIIFNGILLAIFLAIFYKMVNINDL